MKNYNDDYQAMADEHKELSEMERQLWILKGQLAELEKQIAKRSYYFVIGDDDLIDIGLGMYR